MSRSARNMSRAWRGAEELAKRRVGSRNAPRGVSADLSAIIPSRHCPTDPASPNRARQRRDQTSDKGFDNLHALICARRTRPNPPPRNSPRRAPSLPPSSSQQNLSSFGGGARRQQARVAHGREGARASTPGGGRPGRRPAPPGRSAPARPVFDTEDRAGALFHQEEPDTTAALGAVHHARGGTRARAPRRARDADAARAPGGTTSRNWFGTGRGSGPAAAPGGTHARRSLRVAQHG